jgi:AraC-like DNA-binding protein
MVKDSSAEGEPEESLVVEQEEEQISKVLDVDDQEFIDKATRIVLDNLSDADFNIDQLCAEMAMSRTLFYGRLKSLTSQAPQEFIRLIKLERAAILLKQGNSVLDVSVRTGFVNVKYFSTLFKKHFGVSPSKCK